MTLLRQLRALPEPSIDTPRELGVGEFAFRCGRRYGTILVDGDSHRVVDLLEDPSTDALGSWLVDHPGVEVICRDRVGITPALTSALRGWLSAAWAWYSKRSRSAATRR